MLLFFKIIFSAQVIFSFSIILQIEPIISPPQNAPFVHHMVLYRCLHPNPELMREYLDQPGINCLDFANMQFDFFHCQSILWKKNKFFDMKFCLFGGEGESKNYY